MSLAAAGSTDSPSASRRAGVMATVGALTCVYDGLEGQVAALRVEGEFVNVHPAGADQHLVVLDLHVAHVVDGQIRTGRSFVLLRPV